MKTIYKLTTGILLVFLSGCLQPAVPTTSVPGIEPTPTSLPIEYPPPSGETPGGPYPEPPVTQVSPTGESPYPGPVEGTPLPGEPDRPEEAIFIQSPGPGSRVTSPILLTGQADSTFEQNLVVRILNVDGQVLHETFTTIQSELGQRGPFSVEIPFNIQQEEQAFIQVFATSARDGEITHLNSVGITMTPSGFQAQVNPAAPQPERITIFSPVPAAVIRGGRVQVEGFALASFEQTLLVELQDENGSVIASQPVIVQSPDLGIPGPFSASLTYSIPQAGPGRVVVRDISPAHGKDSHLSSAEVRLEP